MPWLDALRAWRPTERVRVRAASWAGAWLVAALALMLLVQPASAPFAQTGDGAAGTIVAAFIEASPEPDAPTPRRERAAAASPRAAHGGAPAAGLAVRLWRTDASGRFLFSNPDQYRRCRAARAQGRDEADCPSPTERGELALAPDARAYADASLDALFAR